MAEKKFQRVETAGKSLGIFSILHFSLGLDKHIRDSELNKGFLFYSYFQI